MLYFILYSGLKLNSYIMVRELAGKFTVRTGMGKFK